MGEFRGTSIQFATEGVFGQLITFHPSYWDEHVINQFVDLAMGRSGQLVYITLSKI